jgi:Cys-rich repeat protein
MARSLSPLHGASNVEKRRRVHPSPVAPRATATASEDPAAHPATAAPDEPGSVHRMTGAKPRGTHRASYVPMTLAHILRVALFTAALTSGTLVGCSSTSSDGCSSAMECGGGEACAGDYGPSCVCESSPACTTDADCKSGNVCDPARGLSVCGTMGDLGCQPACTAEDDCAAWQSCAQDGHCQARTCSACPSYLSCPAGGSCGPKSCSTGDDCTGGYCVNGECQATLGQCQPECV